MMAANTRERETHRSYVEDAACQSLLRPNLDSTPPGARVWMPASPAKSPRSVHGAGGTDRIDAPTKLSTGGLRALRKLEAKVSRCEQRIDELKKDMRIATTVYTVTAEALQRELSELLRE